MTRSVGNVALKGEKYSFQVFQLLFAAKIGDGLHCDLSRPVYSLP